MQVINDVSKFDILDKVVKIGVEATTIKTLATLIRYMDNNGIVVMPYSFLEMEIGKDKRSISRHIKKFREQKIIDVLKSGNKNKYKINIDILMNK